MLQGPESLRVEVVHHPDAPHLGHRGRGELETVTAAQLVRSHRKTREDYYRFSVGMIGAEAMLRLFSEEEANERAFTAVTRFLDLLDDTPHAADRPTLDPLGLAFQLKLLWLAGYLPHVSACAECGADEEPLVGYSTRAGGAVCARCAPATEALALTADAVAGIETLLARPLADAGGLGLSERARRDALRVVTASYEYHGGFRLRTLSA
ncbi:MAG TPA: DNA repair protein RecO [Gaiellaceae bacterium]|nr:DNA repair protein RecO [Gaiellaceae bacterium]